jgi:RHS repeat-associated protein
VDSLVALTTNPITTIHATGAQLSWSAYTNSTGNSGKDLASYQVHRSVFQSFTPSASTRIATVPSGTTSFTDTTNTPTPPGGLGNAFYYMIAVKTKDGTVIPGPVQLVRLPTAGSTVQIVNASAATSLSSAKPTTVEQHITGQPWTSVGDDSATFGTTRSVFAFPSMASAGIPSDATVSEAHLKLWGFYNDSGSPTAAYDAYELTQSFTASQATWNNAATGTPWTTAGGTYSSTLQSQVTDLNPDPSRHNWAVTAAVKDWITTPAHEDGLIVKLDSSAIAERELFTDTTAPEAALRPELVVTYTEPAPQDTYYAPSLPDPMSSNTSYTVPVTLTNTTAATWSTTDWVLSYHWLASDGTDLSTSADQLQTALPASMAPSSVATVNASIKTPDTSSSGDARSGYQLAWDLYDKTTGTWLSSGTSTPVLTAVSATRLGAAAPAAGDLTVPMAQGNNTVATLKQAASVEQPSSDLLGLEKFYQYTGVNTGSGGSLLNNDDAGNVVWNYNAFSNPSRGFQTFVRLSYNSMDTTESSMGFGWSLQASSLMRLGTPLDFLPNPPQNATTVKLTDGDGTSHLFTKNSDGTWASPPGVHYDLQNINASSCSANGKDPIAKAWLMTAPDRTQFWFDCQGYQTAVIDNNGNEADFSYTQRNSSNQPREFLDYITDPTGRQTLTVSYYAKGDTYNYIDANGNVATGTNLTNPDIIDMVKSLTDVSGRTVTFLYNVQGEMAQMTDGDGTPLAKVFKFGYDPTQGNKNVKLVSVTDPRGNTTHLAYYTAPQDPKFKWSLETITDRMQNATGFAYTEQSGGGIQAVVTDPRNNATTYVMDATGRPTHSTNALNQATTLAWDSDNNVTSLTQPNGAQSTWTYDPNTGYPLTSKDAQANHDGTAGTTFTYQTALNGHVADMISKLTPQQRLWTFSYDANGNLASVTKPLGNAPGATAGSFTTKYTYDGSGDLLTSTDPLGNITKYGPTYDPSGYPATMTVPTGDPAHPVPETTAYTYDVRGNVTAVKDPLGNTTTQAYDVFGRPLQRVVPKTSTVSLTTPAPVYDGNDNVTQVTAANGAVTSYAFNANDHVSSQVTTPDTSASPSPTTTYTYDANGNLATQTAPDGNVPGATAGSYTMTYGYDAINELTSMTDPLGGVARYGYDNVGDRNSVTDPGGHQSQTVYNLNHQVTQTTDAAGNTTKTAYDLDGLVTSATDQNGNTVLYTVDADGQITQAQVPAQAPGAPLTYDTTQYAYDQDGNQTQVISPRGVASGISGAYTTQTKYTANNQVSAVLTPYLPGDATYGTPAETDYGYDADGRLSSVSAPPSGNSTNRNVTNYDYFDNGWAHDSTDPTGITTSYDYNSLGEQISRVLASPTGDLSRTITWGYYPDGKLASLSDQGVPTGLYAEVIEANDPGVKPTGTWTTTPCGTTAGCEGAQYATHAPGTGADSYTWHLYVPADGNYTVYVKYPVVSGAATKASFTVNYSSGTGTATATATVDQTQNNNNGWVSLGKWAFTQAGQDQQVSLAENSGGTVVAGAVKIVRDNSGDTNTSNHNYAYTYDANANQTGIADTSPGAPVANYVTAYDQDGRLTSVTEENSSGGTIHATSYVYDAASNLTSQTHDGAPSTYDYNNLNQLARESDAKSSSDTSPQVTAFTYSPIGQVASEVKPNENTVTSTYYANGPLYQQTENTSGGTLVASNQYAYDPNGNMTQNVGQLMSADDSGSYLKHTLGYAYDPMDQVTSVTTDGTQTESYTHDADNNVTRQAITTGNTTITTDYNYYQGRLVTAMTSGVTTDYNYDPFGRLDTVTSSTGQTLQSNTYDGFDSLASTSQWNASTNSMDTTTYTHDSLGRVTSQNTAAGTYSYAYLGLSGELVAEQDPGGQSKTYDYTPGGARLSQTTTAKDGTATPGYYTYNAHSDVQAVTGASGTTTATYGYTAYGSPVTSMFTGQDKSDATASPTSSTQPYNSYRFNAMRWDSSTGQYDMGFRNYDPSLNQFVSRDMYEGALEDSGLTTDPFTGSRYAFGNGNPVTNIENDGHMVCDGEGHCGSIQSFEPGGANYQAPVTAFIDKAQQGDTIFTYNGRQYKIPSDETRAAPENVAVRNALNEQLKAQGDLYTGPLTGGSKGSGDVYLATFEPKAGVKGGTPDLIRVTFENGQPVGLTRVDLYRVGATTNMKTIQAEVKNKLSSQADEVVIEAEGRTPQGVKDILNATNDAEGARTVIQLDGPKPVAVRAEPGEGAPMGDPEAGGAADAGEILGPLGWILLYLDIQKHGGIFSRGGCEVIVPANLCPAPPQGPI